MSKIICEREGEEIDRPKGKHENNKSAIFWGLGDWIMCMLNWSKKMRQSVTMLSPAWL